MAIEAPGSPTAVECKAGSPRGETRRRFRIAAALGGLLLVLYPYVTVGWAPAEGVLLLTLAFGLLLVGYAVLAAFAIRASVIAPFVVAALLLPWACAVAVLAGTLHREDAALDRMTISEFGESGDSSLDGEDAYTARSSAKDEQALQAADAKLASAASQAAADLNASGVWPQRVSSDVITVTASLQAMATAAHQMAEANTPDERDEHHGEFSDAETARAVSAAALRKGLGLSEAD